MIANSSGNVLRRLKPTNFSLFGLLLCGALTTPIITAQTSQTPQGQGTPSQATSTQASQVQPVPVQSGRKVKSNPSPDYPELARKLNIQGMARVLLTVSPDGKVASVKDLGGSPILVAALSDAVKKWKYEPADRESRVEVRFEFVQNR